MSSDVQPSAKLRRRWLTLSLRGLMILVLLLSLPMGWIARDVVRAQREANVISAIENAGGFASFQYQSVINLSETPEPPGPWILRRLFGDHLHAHIDYVSLYEPEGVDSIVPQLVHFHRLEFLSLPEAPLNDRSVEVISQLPTLRELDLSKVELTIEQMRVVLKAPQLKSIWLSNDLASDEVLELLPTFAPQLEEINLAETTITDVGMHSLGRLPHLTYVDIEGAPEVTNRGLASLADCQKLVSFNASATSIDEGCLDTLQKLPHLDDVSIDPDELDVAIYEWGLMRLDTLKPVQVPEYIFPICGTCGGFQPKRNGPRVVNVRQGYITVRRYDEDQVTDIEPSPQKVFLP